MDQYRGSWIVLFAALCQSFVTESVNFLRDDCSNHCSTNNSQSCFITYHESPLNCPYRQGSDNGAPVAINFDYTVTPFFKASQDKTCLKAISLSWEYPPTDKDFDGFHLTIMKDANPYTYDCVFFDVSEKTVAQKFEFSCFKYDLTPAKYDFILKSVPHQNGANAIDTKLKVDLRYIVCPPAGATSPSTSTISPSSPQVHVVSTSQSLLRGVDNVTTTEDPTIPGSSTSRIPSNIWDVDVSTAGDSDSSLSSTGVANKPKAEYSSTDDDGKDTVTVVAISVVSCVVAFVIVAFVVVFIVYRNKAKQPNKDKSTTPGSEIFTINTKDRNMADETTDPDKFSFVDDFKGPSDIPGFQLDDVKSRCYSEYFQMVNNYYSSSNMSSGVKSSSKFSEDEMIFSV